MDLHSKNFNEDYVICPYCGYQHKLIPNCLPCGDSDIRCANCSKEFLVEKLKDVGYETFEYTEEN
jgi:DNA-directed RNA polymerase subunit RPC12/RpoP